MPDPVKVPPWTILPLVVVALTSAELIRFELGKGWSNWENLSFTVAWCWLVASGYMLIVNRKKRP
jgi:hypothetical protein